MRKILGSLITLVALTGTAHAGDIAVYGGQFSAFRDNKDKTALLGVEYRFKDQYNGLRPTIGTSANFDGATYTYAGAYWDLPLNTGRFVISPGFAVGGYTDGSSKDLGYGLEFRSTMEVTYKFQNGQRFGAQVSHLSNAGLGDHNPGTETVQAVYSHPL